MEWLQSNAVRLHVFPFLPPYSAALPFPISFHSNSISQQQRAESFHTSSSLCQLSAEMKVTKSCCFPINIAHYHFSRHCRCFWSSFCVFFSLFHFPFLLTLLCSTTWQLSTFIFISMGETTVRASQSSLAKVTLIQDKNGAPHLPWISRLHLTAALCLILVFWSAIEIGSGEVSFTLWALLRVANWRSTFFTLGGVAAWKLQREHSHTKWSSVSGKHTTLSAKGGKCVWNIRKSSRYCRTAKWELELSYIVWKSCTRAFDGRMEWGRH